MKTSPTPDAASWRHHLHRHPETGFQEVATSRYMADVLTAIGLEPVTGVDGTGVVASVSQGTGRGAIGLRADMDGLPLMSARDCPTPRSIRAGCTLAATMATWRWFSAPQQDFRPRVASTAPSDSYSSQARSTAWG